MAAGLELFATVGYGNSSVRALCAEASLNSRYFYEAFESREDLLYNVYQRIVGEIVSNVAEAVQREHDLVDQTRAGLRAGWTTVTEDPRKARIVAREVVGVSERLERLRRETRHALAKITAEEAVALAPSGTRFRLDPILRRVRSLVPWWRSCSTGRTVMWMRRWTRSSNTSRGFSRRRPTQPSTPVPRWRTRLPAREETDPGAMRPSSWHLLSVIRHIVGDGRGSELVDD